MTVNPSTIQVDTNCEGRQKKMKMAVASPGSEPIHLNFSVATKVYF